MMILGIDYGTKKTGLALLDSERQLVMPLSLVTKTEDPLENILTTCKQYGVTTIVLGKPPRKSIARKVDELAKKLETLGYKIHYVGEGLSSIYAQSMLSSLKKTHGAKSRQLTSKDSLSAALILEEWLTQSKQINQT